MSSDDSQIKEFRNKTIARILDKRREQEREQLRSIERSRAESHAFRQRWRESVKEKRHREVIEAVDQYQIKKVIYADSEGAPATLFRQKKEENEKHLHALTSGLQLKEDSEHLDHKRDTGSFTVSVRDNDLRQVTFEFTSGCVEPASVRYLQRIGSFDLRVKDKIRKPWRTSERASNGSTNLLQLTELLSDLLLVKPGRGEDVLLSQHVPCGSMLQLLQDAERPSPWTRSLYVEKSPPLLATSLFSPPTRLSSSDVNGDSNAQPTATSKNKDSQQSQLFAQLVENCFILGPDDQQIFAFLRALQPTPSADIVTQKPFGGGRASFSVPASTLQEPARGTLRPSVLFQNDNDYPAEMMTMLPMYCFPSGVEIEVLPATRDTVRRSVAQQSQTISASAVDTKTKKKFKVFFPSDFSLKESSESSEKAKQPESPLTPLPNSSSLIGVKSASSLGSRQPFVLLLGDHTYQQYCIGHTFGVSFFDPSLQTVVQTTYTVCLLSKLPFFAYISYLLTKVEEDLKFMQFDSPLSRFDPNFPLNAQLRMFHDIFVRLNKVMVPIFPYLISSHLKPAAEPQPAGYDTAESVAHAVITPNAGPSPATAVTVPSSFGATLSSVSVDARIDANYVAIVPDISAKITLKNTDNKLIDFKRSQYQIFYSNHARNFEEISDNLLANIKFHEKFKSSFVPTPAHKQEKDKEDSFLILQWALPTLLKYLPLDQISLCLGCAVTEMKIIVKHKDINVVSSVMLSLIQLLKPLKWCSPVIVTLPDELTDFIESPVPIMLGMQKLPSNFVLLEGQIVVDPQEHTVHLHPNDVKESHTRLLPNASRLVAALRSSADTILQITRKRKTQRQKVVINHPEKIPLAPAVPRGSTKTSDSKGVAGADSEAFSAFRADSSPVQQSTKSMLSTASVSPPAVIPLELDISHEDCVAFSGAVMQFSTLVSNHIHAILNTGIQIQQRDKEKARLERRVAKKVVASPVKPSGKTSPMPAPAQRAIDRQNSVDAGTKAHQNRGIFRSTGGKADAVPPPPQDTTPPPLSSATAPPQPASQHASGKIPFPAEVSFPVSLHGHRSHSDQEDSVSDVTCSDLQETNTMSSNEMESVREEVSSAASVSSNSSSLPSLQSNAPVLLMKDLGMNGTTFVRKVIDTQMYSNYCQSLKVHSDAQTLDGSLYPIESDGASSPHNSTLMSANNGNNNLISNTINIGNMFGFEPEEEEVIVDERDAVADMFEIVLCGSVAMQPETMEELRKRYNELYASSEMTREKLMRCVPPISQETSRMSRSRRRLKELQQQVLQTIATKRDVPLRFQDKESIAGKLLYCTGLLCDGFCNTDRCSDLCLSLWETRVHCLRHRQAAFEIVSRKYEKPMSTANNASNITTDTTQTPAQTQSQAQKVEFLTAKGVRLQPQRHLRETESQFAMRKQAVVEGIACASLKQEKDTSKELRRKRRARRKEQRVVALSVTVSPKTTKIFAEHIKKREFVGADNEDPYLHAVARHFAKRETRLVQRVLKRARAVIVRFIRGFVRLYRKARFHRAVVYCQANIRGFIVRRSLPELVETLYLRKQIRFCAKMRIRNYVRHHMDLLLKNWGRQRDAIVRKKRTSISLPVHVGGLSSSSSTSAANTEREGTPRVDSPVVLAPPSKFISEPSLPLSSADVSQGERQVNQVPFSASAEGAAPSQRKSTAAGLSTMAMNYINFGMAFKNTTNTPSLSSRLSKRSSLTIPPRYSSHTGSSSRHTSPSVERVLLSSPSGKLSASRPPLSPSVSTSPPSSLPPLPLTPTSLQPVSSASTAPAPAPAPAPMVPASSFVISASASVSSGTSTITDTPSGNLVGSSAASNNVVLGTIISASTTAIGTSTVPNNTAGISSKSTRPELHVQIPSDDLSQSPTGTTSSSQGAPLTPHPTNGSARRSPTVALSQSIEEVTMDALLSPSVPLLKDHYVDSMDEETHRLFLSASVDFQLSNSNEHDAVHSLLQGSPTAASAHDLTASSKKNSAVERERRASIKSEHSENSESFNDAMSVCTVDRNYAHVNRLLPPGMPEKIATTSLVSSSASIMSSSTSKTAAGKTTPLMRFVAENNYAVDKLVSTSTLTPLLSKHSLKLHTRTDTLSIASSRSFLDDANDTRSDRNTLVSSDKSCVEEVIDDDSDVEEHLTQKLTEPIAPHNEEPGADIAAPVAEEEKTPISLSVRNEIQPLPIQPPSLQSIPPPTAATTVVMPDSPGKYNAKTVSTEDDDLYLYEEDTGPQPIIDEASNDLANYPMKTFGILAGDHFSSPQVKLIKSMYALLREGVHVFKHGRKGKPSQKVIYCDLAMTKLYWRNPGTKRDKEDSENESQSGFRLKRRSSGIFGGGGRRSSLVSKDDSEREILIQEITEVTSECVSDVLQRSVSKHYVGMDGCNVLCILAKERSLDLEIELEKWDKIYRALQVVVDFYKQQPGPDSPSKFSSPIALSSQSINFEEVEDSPIPQRPPPVPKSVAPLFEQIHENDDIGTISTTSLGVRAGIVDLSEKRDDQGLQYARVGKKRVKTSTLTLPIS